MNRRGRPLIRHNNFCLDFLSSPIETCNWKEAAPSISQRDGIAFTLIGSGRFPRKIPGPSAWTRPNNLEMTVENILVPDL